MEEPERVWRRMLTMGWHQLRVSCWALGFLLARHRPAMA